MPASRTPVAAVVRPAHMARSARWVRDSTAQAEQHREHDQQRRCEQDDQARTGDPDRFDQRGGGEQQQRR